MRAEIDDQLAHGIDHVEARQALERIIGDPRLKVGDRQKAILSYLVERRFEGRDVKAYSIAVDVLGRSRNFDPATDPIVRIEISRLRAAMEAYYFAFGSEHDVQITIRKGKYVACFTRTAGVPRRDGGCDEPDIRPIHEVERDDIQYRAREPRWRRTWIAAMLGASAAVVAFATYTYASRSTIAEKPTVYVSVEAVSPTQVGEASQMRDQFVTALTQFQTINVAHLAYTSVRTNGASRRYAVELKYYGDSDGRSVRWQVVANSSGTLLMSGVVRVATAGRSIASVRDEIVAGLAKRIASNRGVINTIELQADTNPLPLGNGCVIRAEYALDVQGDIDAAANCLQQTLRIVPDDSDAGAVLARILVARGGRETARDVADRALDLAKDAVARAPLSDRAQLALMAVQSAKGSLDVAIEAGNRAIALNPNNPDAEAALAGVLYSAGYRRAGVSMAADASKGSDTVPRCALVVLALDAFRDGLYSEALLWTEQVNGSSPLTRVIRAAALGELGSDQARESLAGIDPEKHGLQSEFKRTVNASGLQPELVSMLEQGLTKAGGDFEPVGSILP